MCLAATQRGARGVSTLLACILTLLLSITAKAEENKFTPPQITVPDGFTIELAAAPPLVKHPMMAGFDDRGRLFVAESAGKNLRRGDLEKEFPNFIRMLEDTNDDGRFDKSTIFADKMTLPMGALWHDGALYVAAPPNIWRLEDTDDDGVADKREVIVDQFGYSGNAASVHGCFLGPGGRLYWCDGRHGHEFRKADGTITSQGKAARIFSCKADGSDVRVHCGGGMDNPVEVDFMPTGEMLGTVNIMFRKRGDCLVHWMHGGVYPRYDQQQCIDEFAKTGDPLLPVYNLGHVAVSGTNRYRSDYLGKDFRNNFFITQFNTHEVVRAKLTREGSTYRADVEKFLSSPSIDFHPTDVLEDADGSLLVIDTGGWFRIGCPVSQVAKPNILGAIYRIRRKDAKPLDDPRGLKIAWEQTKSQQLTALLGDPRFAVRDKAVAVLAKRGNSAVDALQKALSDLNPEVRRNAVWALTRIGSPAAQAVARTKLDDLDTDVRQAAAYSAGITVDQRAVSRLTRMVNGDLPPVRREAATALGKIGGRKAVPALLSALGSNVDRVLEHAIIYALIEINDPVATSDGLTNTAVKIRRGALTALDQMPDGKLTRDQVTPLLDTSDFALQKTALEVIGKHEGWGAEIIGLLEKLLAQNEIAADRQAMVRGALVAFRNDEKIQTLVGKTLAGSKTTPAVRRLLLEVIGRSDLKPLPESWAKALQQSLASSHGEVLAQAIATTAQIDGNQFDDQLLALAGDAARPVGLRVESLVVAASHGRAVNESGFQLLSQQIDEDAPPMRRLSAARAIGSATLTAKQIAATTQLVAVAGPLEMSPLLAAFEKNDNPQVGHRLVLALNKSPGLSSLSAAQLQKLFANYPVDVRSKAKPLLARLEAAGAQQKAHLAELEPNIADGDVQRGKAIFLSKKTSCFACHRVGNDGGRVGPDLSTVGQRRNNRDLLEAIVFPSASLARGFETYNIGTDDGRVVAGVITGESTDAITLRTNGQTDLHIPRDEIEEMAPSRLSIMPAGLEKTMTVDELRDLIAYLRSLK